MDRFSSGNGDAAQPSGDDLEQVLEFVSKAVLVETMDVASVTITDFDNAIAYGIRFIGSHEGTEAETRVMVSGAQATALILALVKAAVEAGDDTFVEVFEQIEADLDASD